MKVLICGSRGITRLSSVTKAMEKAGFTITEIISGGAIGVDTLAINYANATMTPVQIFKPDWKTHGKKAGILRNIEMVNEADAVIAIWDKKSRGTKSTIDYTRKVGKPLFVHTVN